MESQIKRGIFVDRYVSTQCDLCMQKSKGIALLHNDKKEKTWQQVKILGYDGTGFKRKRSHEGYQ